MTDLGSSICSTIGEIAQMWLTYFLDHYNVNL